MENPSITGDVWSDLEALINSLPSEQRRRYRTGFKVFLHDVRQNFAIINNAEALLRRAIPSTPENVSLLDSIQSANQSAASLVAEFAQPFEIEPE